MTCSYSYDLPKPKQERVRICFDVDGVLADHRGDPEYKDRVPYSWVADRLRVLQDAGYFIVLQTARYMKQCDGSQGRAHQEGYFELKDWADSYQIPYDEIYLGKASAVIYVDDRAFQIRSDKGEQDWDSLFMALDSGKI